MFALNAIVVAVANAVTKYVFGDFLKDCLKYRLQNLYEVDLEWVHNSIGNNVTSCFQSEANCDKMHSPSFSGLDFSNCLTGFCRSTKR